MSHWAPCVDDDEGRGANSHKQASEETVVTACAAPRPHRTVNEQRGGAQTVPGLEAAAPMTQPFRWGWQVPSNECNHKSLQADSPSTGPPRGPWEDSGWVAESEGQLAEGMSHT